MVKIGITGNVKKVAMQAAVHEVVDQLKGRAVTIIMEDRFARSFQFPESGVALDRIGKTTDLVISFGGDGTMLSIAKKLSVSKTPVLGINIGHLGFLTECAPQELPGYISDLVNGNYHVEERIMVEAVISDNPDEIMYAINDFVIDKGGYPRSVKIGLSVAGELCHIYSSDGLIIATATGSTAYSLSAGGPILYPTIKDLLITPICPHTLTARPMIVPGDFPIEVEIISGPSRIPFHADGLPGREIAAGQKVTIRRSSRLLKLIHLPTHSFFTVLRTKLGWGTQNGESV